MARVVIYHMQQEGLNRKETGKIAQDNSAVNSYINKLIKIKNNFLHEKIGLSLNLVGYTARQTNNCMQFYAVDF